MITFFKLKFIPGTWYHTNLLYNHTKKLNTSKIHAYFKSHDIIIVLHDSFNCTHRLLWLMWDPVKYMICSYWENYLRHIFMYPNTTLTMVEVITIALTLIIITFQSFIYFHNLTNTISTLLFYKMICLLIN